MLRFVDAQFIIGRRLYYREGSLRTQSDILEMMDRCHIDQAIVCHSVSLENDPMVGNLMLLEDTANTDRFLRQWSVLPHTFEEFPTPDVLLQSMKNNHVTSVRLCPGTYQHSLQPYVLGPLMQALAECYVPIFIDANQLTWDSLYHFCQDNPAASIVLTTSGYEYQRLLGPLLEACPNLYLGTNRYVSHNGIQKFCKTFGASRLLFESAMPYYSAAAGVGLICYAQISEEEKQLIASGNVLHLISEVTL